MALPNRAQVAAIIPGSHQCSIIEGVPSPATPEVLQVKCSDDCKGPAPCILAVGSNVTGATADGMDLAIGLRCGRSNAYIWHCGRQHGCRIPFSMCQKVSASAPTKGYVLMHRLLADSPEPYLEGSGLTKLQAEEVMAAFAENRQVNLQVFKWMGVPWTDLSKPAGSTCAAVYFAEKQGAKICFQVAGFSTPRHAGITVKWAASKMGMDIRKLDYIAGEEKLQAPDDIVESVLAEDFGLGEQTVAQLLIRLRGLADKLQHGQWVVTDNDAIAEAHCQGEAAFPAAASAGGAGGTSNTSSSGDSPCNALPCPAAPTAPQAAATAPDAASAAANLGSNAPAGYIVYEESAMPSMYGPSGLQYRTTPLQGGDIFQDYLQLAGSLTAGAVGLQPMPSPNPPSYEVEAPYVSAATSKAPNTLRIAPPSGIPDLQASAALQAAGPEAQEQPAHPEHLMLLGMAPSVAAISRPLAMPHIMSPQPDSFAQAHLAAAAAAGGSNNAFEGYPDPLVASRLLGGVKGYEGSAQVTADDMHHTALEQHQQQGLFTGAGFYGYYGYGGYDFWQDPGQTFTAAEAAAGPLQGLLPPGTNLPAAGKMSYQAPQDRAAGEPEEDSRRRPRRVAATAAQRKPTFVDSHEFDELLFWEAQEESPMQRKAPRVARVKPRTRASAAAAVVGDQQEDSFAPDSPQLPAVPQAMPAAAAAEEPQATGSQRPSRATAKPNVTYYESEDSEEERKRARKRAKKQGATKTPGSSAAGTGHRRGRQVLPATGAAASGVGSAGAAGVWGLGGAAAVAEADPAAINPLDILAAAAMMHEEMYNA